MAVSALCLFLTVSRIVPQPMNVAFPGHAHLLFFICVRSDQNVFVSRVNAEPLSETHRIGGNR